MCVKLRPSDKEIPSKLVFSSCMAAEENVAFGAYISRKRIQDPVSIKHLKSDTTCKGLRNVPDLD